MNIITHPACPNLMLKVIYYSLSIRDAIFHYLENASCVKHMVRKNTYDYNYGVKLSVLYLRFEITRRMFIKV